MPDPTELIEECELEIWNIIHRLHRGGVKYSIVHSMFNEIIKTLEMKGYADDWLNKFNKSR